MAAEAFWLLANRRYLPRTQRRQALGSMIFTVALLIVFVWMPGGSGWGHGGGAVAGAIAAALFQVQRFGPAAFRVPALVSVALLPFVVLVLLQRDFADDKFEQLYLPPVNRLARESEGFFRGEVKPILDRNARRRDPEAVAALLRKLDQKGPEASQLAAALGGLRPRRDPAVEEARQVARNLTAALASLYDQSARCLRAGKDWIPTGKDDQALEAQQRQVEKLRKEWRDLLQ
jgi:hypothetical protein